MKPHKYFLVLVSVLFLAAFSPLSSFPAEGSIQAAESLQVADLSRACFAPAADSYTSSLDSGANFGGSSRLVVRRVDTEEFRSFLRFDISGLPGDVVLHSARLRFALGDAEYDGSRTEVYPVLAPWEEGSITHENQPDVGDLYGVADHTLTEGWKSWDVTALVQEWYKGQRDNYGLSIRAAASPLSMAFSSSEGSETSHPELCIEYSSQDMISEAEALDAVGSSSRLEPELQESTPSDALLAYLIEDFSGELVPGYWLVQLGDPESPRGYVGIDPHTGTFQFETMVSATYRFPEINLDRVAGDLDSHDINPENYLLDQARFTFIGGGQIAEGNYWLLPSTSGEMGDMIAFPAFEGGETRIAKSLEGVGILPLFTTEDERPYYRLGDGLWVEAQRGFSEGETSSAGGMASGKLNAPGASSVSDGGSGSVSEDFDPVTSGSASPAASNHKIKLGVPLFYQGDTNGCGPYALSMAHQWWSPVDLGFPRNQAYEITQFQGDPGDYGPNLPRHLDDVIENWDKVDSSYEDFQSTDTKRGSVGNLKNWISRDFSPSAVLVNSDSKSVGFFDHWVLVTGFNNNQNKLYLNNSGAKVGSSQGSRGSVAYGKFKNSYWKAWGAKNHWYGVGIPGDRNIASVSPLTPQLTGDIEDDQMEQVSNLGLSIVNDGAQEGADSFGDGAGKYETKVVVEYVKGEGLFRSVQEGDFDAHNITAKQEIEFIHDSGTSQGDTLNQAVVHLDPGNIGPDVNSLGYNEINIEYHTHDEDDRVHHASNTIKVYEFAPNSNCNYDNPPATKKACYNKKNMQKPVRRGTFHEDTFSFQVSDDEPDGPEISDLRPTDGTTVLDAHSGPISLKATVDDPFSSTFWEGIEYVTLSYTIRDASGTWINDGTKTYHPSSSTVQPFTLDVPRSDWVDGVHGGTIEWLVEAKDTDYDRPGDSSTTTTNLQTVNLEDDDTQGPTLTDQDSSAKLITQSGQKKVKYTFKFKMTDPEGVVDNSIYPEVHLDWEGGGSQELNADWNGTWYTATQVSPLDRRDETLYWKVKALDDDDDRASYLDRAESWSSRQWLEIPPKLCTTPDPIDHDFGVMSNRAGGKTTDSWTFELSNCGGQPLTVFGGVDQLLQRSGGSTPSCPKSKGHCWLGVSGIPSGGERITGGNSRTITLNINTLGFDYQVPVLTPGNYQGKLNFYASSTSYNVSVSGPVDVSIPELDVTSPGSGDLWNKGSSQTIIWDSPHLPSGEQVKLELQGAAHQTIVSSTANDGSYTWSVPGTLPDGNYQIKLSSVTLPTITDTGETFQIGNVPPDKPDNQQPPHDAQGIPQPLELAASSFSDPNLGDTHEETQWQIRRDAGSYSSPAWDTTETGSGDLTAEEVPAGTLPRFAPTKSFTIEGSSKGPVLVSGSLPVDVREIQRVTITFENVGTSRYKLVVSIPPDYVTKTIDPGNSTTLTFRPQLTGRYPMYIATSGGGQVGPTRYIEVDPSVYWWRVRYRDSQGNWSPWSSETSFAALEEMTGVFTDVPRDHWAYEWILALYEAGLTSGYPDGSYRPENGVSRAEMAVFLERGIHGSVFTPPDVPARFGDTAGHWAQDWIAALAEDGITAGCGGGDYCPDEGVSREEMAVFLLRSIDVSPGEVSGTVFDDVPEKAHEWAVPYIEELYEQGITAGCGGGNYCPQETVTRAEMAVFLVNTFNLPLP